MENYSFSEEQKKAFSLKKYLKEHAFEYVLTIIVNMCIVAFVLWIGGGTRYWLCLGATLVYSIIKIIFRIISYRKDYLK